MLRYIEAMSADAGEVNAWIEAAVAPLALRLGLERVLLFGSRARGTASRRSDIDLFVVWDTPLAPLERIGRILSELRDAPRPVEAIVYTPRELRERAQSRFVKRILAEGRVLHER